LIAASTIMVPAIEAAVPVAVAALEEEELCENKIYSE
jgi:hypothetical protein